ncbi:hypothetical protein OLMES_0868 [Oleiphilus messinensis]|uniref:Uncharacterized protein n=1 Tax=Oleiphilus messinensis TaxID=141451 RepID=A0A1Y0I5Z2_9GAMM|nr:hypothetical protein [Oleiphilus messinensis]ARU54955.1 hypothetical protein OLMES_0868 [Oleiphilus messinensis]
MLQDAPIPPGPLTQAVLNCITPNELTTAARRQTSPGSIRAYLFGRPAIELLCRGVTQRHSTHQVSLEFKVAKLVNRQDIVLHNHLDQHYRPPTLQPTSRHRKGPQLLHDEFDRDAIQLERRFIHSPVWVYCAAPEDVATTLLWHCSQEQLSVISMLLSLPTFSPDRFIDRATDTIRHYPALTSKLSANLASVMNLFRAQQAA